MKLTRKSTIYILCPPKYATGGTELLHQLCNSLIENNVNAKMFYWPIVKNPTSPQFEKYKLSISEKIEDSLENVFIAPEIDNYKIFEYKNIQKIVWWLSIDNHFKNKNLMKRNLKLKVLNFLFRRRYFDFNDKKTICSLHLAQSYYAKKFLNSKGINNVKMLSDYINDDFFINEIDEKNKNDIVLYNPKKGIEFTNKLIEHSVDRFNWVPIQNLTRDGVKELLQKAKVYIDFGEHPGKDRFPRESAISGCCIITNMQGSASNDFDVNIPKEYKFEGIETEIPKILELIDSCLSDYLVRNQHFEEYRQTIRLDKHRFEEEVKNVFQINP